MEAGKDQEGNKGSEEISRKSGERVDKDFLILISTYYYTAVDHLGQQIAATIWDRDATV